MNKRIHHVEIIVLQFIFSMKRNYYVIGGKLIVLNKSIMSVYSSLFILYCL